MTDDGGEAESFWRFSLMVYGRPGVAEALIALQDRGGHNVNLVLFGLWLAIDRSARLDAAGLARAKAAIKRLDRDIVQQLRRLRRALKDDPDPDIQDLRRRVMALELAAERRVQARLAASIASRRDARAGSRTELVDANLRLILGADCAAAEAEAIRQAVSGIEA